MKNLSMALVATSLLFVASTTAHAETVAAGKTDKPVAAKPVQVSLTQVPEVAVQSQTKGFYAKVYGGATFGDLSLSHLGVNGDYSNYHWQKSGDIDTSYLVGVGLGYRINDLFRVELSYDYRGKSDFDGRDGNALSSRKYEGELSSSVVMANAYLDLGTVKNITPYIGFGLGGAYNKVSDASVDYGNSKINLGSHSEWDFAWALHAGVAYQLSERMVVELGYSYIDLGEARSGSSVYSGHSKVKDLTAHDIKVGLRYSFH